MYRTYIIAIAFALAITTLFYKNEQNISKTRETKNMNVTATLPVKLDITKLDPANISFADEYTVLEHIYSPLVEVNKKGELIPGLAEKFEWHGNEAHFTLRTNFILPNGRPLDSEDVILSLKRLLVLDKNVHGKISSLLCLDKKMTKIEDDCTSISKIENKVILKLKHKVPFLFKILASIDYAILPREVIDLKTLKIKDFKNSTGPYTLKSSNDGTIELSINKHHYHYSPKAPQEIKYIVPSKSSIELLRSGKLDIITTDDSTSTSAELINASEDGLFNLHQTFKIKTSLLTFTRKGKESILPERRFIIGKIIRDVFNKKITGSTSSEPTFQFFPKLSEAGLSPDDIKDIEKRYSNIELSEEKGKGIKLYVSPKKIKSFKALISPKLPLLEIVSDHFPDPFDNSSKNVDMFIANTDTGFLEEVGLISYSVNFGYFGLTKKESSEWLKKYTRTISKTKRLELLRTLHINALTEPTVVPLYHSPYVALSTLNWEMDFSQFYSNSQLWHLRKN